MKTLYKMQDWFADRISWVQYPHIHAADATTKEASRTGLRFKTAMPIGKRIDIVLFSILLLLIGGIALIVACVLIYVLLF